MAKRADSGPTGFQTPTPSTQESGHGFQDFGSVDSGPSGYGDDASNPRDFDGYGTTSAEAAAQRGNLSQRS